MNFNLIRKIALTGGAFLLMSVVSAFAQQQYTITGKVVDANNGQPLVGVAVLNSNGGGEMTDIDGVYALTVTSDATLTFNYLGYLDVVEKVAGRTVIDVKMTVDNELLDEVVVLGYTSQKKNELSSSVVSVNTETLKDMTTSDLGNMIQGKAAGVLVSNRSGQPGEGADIRIRGTGSISAGAGPLYVVDGVAGGSFNPNDVESLTILKDASATALYGASASGGVIVVTTKSAKSDKATVNFRASAGIKKALMGRFKPMDTEELYNAKRSMYKSDRTFLASYPAEILETNFDWTDAAFQTGVVQDYYASVGGRAGQLSYFASLSHYDEEGSLVNTGYNRSSARVNLSAPLGKSVKLDMRFNYDRSNSNGTTSWRTLDGAYRNMPWDTPYDVNTNELLYISGNKRPDNGKPWYSQNIYSFLHNQEYNYNRSNSEDIVADVALTWNITDWLIFTTTNRFNSSNWTSERYYDARTQEGIGDNGNIYNGNGSGTGFGTTNLLKASKAFGNHSINGVIGYEYGSGYSRSMHAEGTGMPVGMTALGSCPTIKTHSGYDYSSRAWALLAQAQYSYMGKYIASASIRYDETSRFAPKARGGYFPGVSAAWLINKENWMQGQDVVSLLKFRAGYGKTGNNAIENFKWQDTYKIGTDNKYQDIVAAVLERRQNPNLGWEEAYMASLGIDVEFTKGINLTVDIYNTDNKNLLLDVPLAPSSGFSSYTANVGTVNNKGIELALDADILNKRNLIWNVGFNIGMNKNTVVDLPNGDFLIDAYSEEVYFQVKEGQDIYTWYMPKWYGVDPKSGDPLWEVVEEDGTITPTKKYGEATQQVVGKATPLFQGGINTMLRYKGFTLSANGSFVYGNKVYNYTRKSMDSDGAYIYFNMMSHDNGLGWSRWQKEGDIATHPKLKDGNKSLSNSTSSRFLEDGSFFRLKNVTLSYNFPQSWIKKINMQGLRVYVAADNIATISKFSGSDPEVALDGSGAGVFAENYPVPMSVVGGIEITF